jgi:tRNA-(ms[2]io[6]A)-hydroxylase
VSGVYESVAGDLPLLCETPRGWAELAAADLPLFLADHAVCEQQAALTALNLIAHYPKDDELVQRMSSLAAEEATHLRRVARILHSRGLKLARRRPNPYVTELHSRATSDREPERKIDRLLVGALIEARSCERFTRLLELVRDDEVAELLRDLGPAEKRHWEMFYGLAARELDAEALAVRWRGWLEWERSLMAELGRSPTVHG